MALVACALVACAGPPDWSPECTATERHLERVYRLPDAILTGDYGRLMRDAEVIADSEHKLNADLRFAVLSGDLEDGSPEYVAIRDGRKAAESFMSFLSDGLETGSFGTSAQYRASRSHLRWQISELRTACDAAAARSERP